MKTKQTELPITVLSLEDDKSNDALTNAKNKIEMAALHLQTIFNLIRTTALHYEGQADSREIQAFFWDVINISSVGNGAADSILAAASDLTEFEIKPETEHQESKKSDAEILAEKISYLITSEDVPHPISDGISEVMTDFYNERIEQTEINNETNSPEHIAKLLKNSLFFTIDGDKTEA